MKPPPSVEEIGKLVETVADEYVIEHRPQDITDVARAILARCAESVPHLTWHFCKNEKRAVVIAEHTWMKDKKPLDYKYYVGCCRECVGGCAWEET